MGAIRAAPATCCCVEGLGWHLPLPSMKAFPLLVACVATLLCATSAAAQAASATWPLLSSQAGTATGLVAAAPEIVSGGSPAMSVFDYTTDGQRLYMGTTGWTAGTAVPTRFVQFDLAVAAGHTFQVGGVSFNYGASAKPSSMASEVWYSTNAWVDSTQLTTSPLGVSERQHGPLPRVPLGDGARSAACSRCASIRTRCSPRPPAAPSSPSTTPSRSPASPRRSSPASPASRRRRTSWRGGRATATRAT